MTKAAPRVGIVDTSLRDTHQSPVTPRLETREMLPIAARLDPVGYRAVEVWGGGTFDICLRWAREDPWERLRALARILPRTPIRAILRGPFLLGYHPYPPDVQEAFLAAAVACGLKSFRIYDALNDVRNIVPIIRRARAAGAEVWGTLVFTRSPHHNTETFVELAGELSQCKVDGISIADVAGLLTPAVTRQIVRGIRSATGLPVHVHSRSATAMAAMAYVAAAEEGADSLDCPLAPFALFSAQPAAETICSALADLGIETGLDRPLLYEAARAAEAAAVGRLKEQAERSVLEVAYTLRQVPGGMLSNIIGLLREHDALGRIEEVLDEIVRVREEFGWPPLTTPITQLVGSQAVFNVVLGERYATVPREVEEYFLGRYGRPPGPVSDEVAARIRRGRSPVDGPAGEDLPPALERARAELGREGLLVHPEDAITYALFPQSALAFFRYRRDPTSAPSAQPAQPAAAIEETIELERLVRFMNARGLSEVDVEEGGHRYHLRRPGGASAAPPSPSSAPSLGPVPSAPAAAPSAADDEARYRKIVSPMAGTFYRAPSPEAPPFVEVGSTVAPETVVCLIEAMKLFNEIQAEKRGRIVRVLVENASPVEYGQPLFLLDPAASPR